MNLGAALSGIVLAATVLSATGVAAASAATPTTNGHGDQAGSAQLTQGFNVVNLSSHPMVYTGAHVPKDHHGSLQSAPPVDAVLEPGATQHFEETYEFSQATEVQVDYVQAAADGHSQDWTKDVVSFDLKITTLDIAESDAGYIGSAGSDVIPAADFSTLTISDRPGSTVTYGPSQRLAAAGMLDSLCQNSTQATCRFVPSTDNDTGTIWSPEQRLAARTQQTPSGTDLQAFVFQVFSTSDNLGLDVSRDPRVFDAVDAAVANSFHSAWSNTGIFPAVYSHPVAAGTQGEIEGRVPVEEATGDLVVTMGNTTFRVQDVVFDHPMLGQPIQYSYIATPEGH
ncbi:hypothetical protein GCM10028798_29590 [Humibacter antri]